MNTKVIVNGAFGRMGQAAVAAIEADSQLQLVGKLGIDDNLAEQIEATGADVVLDLTVATSAYQNLQIIIEVGAHPIIGTSGLTAEQIAECQAKAQTKNLGGIIVPNFSIGAVLMMQMAEKAAHYLGDVEIIEMHHDGKQDAPSGTAARTAELINAARRQAGLEKPPLACHEDESRQGSRGANYENIAVHAVRLPGVVASQRVIFGSQGETLTIAHDSIDRQCFMPGVLLCCKQVAQLTGLEVGLDVLL